MTLSFKGEGDSIYLIGKNVDDIAGSEYLYSYHQIKASPAPYFNLEEEYELQEAVKELIRQRLVNAVHDVADGGLFVALAESAMAGGVGFAIQSPSEIRKDAFLFGEAQGRIVVSLAADQENLVKKHLASMNVPYLLLGKVIAQDFLVDGSKFMQLNDACAMYQNTLVQQLS